MRKTIILGMRYLVIILIVTGYLSFPLEASAHPLADGANYFKGTIGNDIGISMRLDIKDGFISGQHAYDSVGIPIYLTGDIDDAGNLVINEYDENATHVGVFRAQIVNRDKIEGIWSRPDGGGKLSFTAVRASGWGGKWVWDYHYNTSGLLEIENATDSEFTFRLNVGNLYRMHTGRIMGTAKISSNEAVWEDGKGARLAFEMEHDKINITAENCRNYAGMGVGFDGSYLREPLLSLVRRGVFEDASKELDFIRLVGDDRKLFSKSFVLISKLKDLDGFGATVSGGGIRIWGGANNVQNLAIVMSSPNGGLWAAVVDEEAKVIRYYTNRPNGETLPNAISAWRSKLADQYEVVFMPSR